MHSISQHNKRSGNKPTGRSLPRRTNNFKLGNLVKDSCAFIDSPTRFLTLCAQQFWRNFEQQRIHMISKYNINCCLSSRFTRRSFLDPFSQLISLDVLSGKASTTSIPPFMPSGSVIIPCGMIHRAGNYTLELISRSNETVLARSRRDTVVGWPTVLVHVPLLIETHSSDASVTFELPDKKCPPFHRWVRQRNARSAF